MLFMVSVDCMDVDDMLALVKTDPLNAHSNMLSGPPRAWQVKLSTSRKFLMGLIGSSSTDPSGETENKISQ